MNKNNKTRSNHYMVPTGLFLDLEERLILSYYWCMVFPDTYIKGLTEINSNVPQDIYYKLLEEVKAHYIARTGDESLDHWSEKQETIDKYIAKNHNCFQNDCILFTYSCSTRMFENIKKVLSDNLYLCNISKTEDNTVTFSSDVEPDVVKYVMERAKMEYFASQNNYRLCVSEKEEKNGRWESAMHSYCKPHIWYTPAEEEIKDLNNETITVVKGENNDY